MKWTHVAGVCLSAAITVAGAAGLIGLNAAAAKEAPAGAGTDWPCFAGPNHDGVSAETGWLTQWPAGGPKPVWRLAVGKGFSSVAVTGGKVYTMGNVNNVDFIYCVDAADGKEVWKKEYECTAGSQHYGPRATPTVDDGRVYTLSREGHIQCRDAKTGQMIWSKDARKEFGAKPPAWAFACSPRIVDQRVIVDVGTVVAMDRATGQVAWKSEAYPAGYSTPALVTVGPRKCLAVFNATGLVILSLADGKEVARYPWKTRYDVNAATPLVTGGKVFISSGYNTGCALVDFSSGEPAVVWQNKNMSNHYTTCVPWKGFLYGINGNANSGGVLTCLNPADGSVKWEHKGLGTGSLILADGKLIVLGEKGDLAVAEASPDGYRSLAQAKVLDGICWTMPVLSNGRVYCRNSDGDLVCVDISGK